MIGVKITIIVESFFLFVDGVGTKKATGLYFVRVDDHGRVLFDFVLEHLLGHGKKLIEVHGFSISHVGL